MSRPPTDPPPEWGDIFDALMLQYVPIGSLGSFGSETLEQTVSLCYGRANQGGLSKSTSDIAASEAMAAYFARVAETFNLPRSVAGIYHTLFVAEKALSFTEIVQESGLSKASASTGLKLLESMLAVAIVHVPNDRNTYYRPELSLRRLAAGFLKQSLLPGLEAGGLYLDGAPSNSDETLSDHYSTRLSSLRSWHASSKDLLPLLAALGEINVDSKT